MSHATSIEHCDSARRTADRSIASTSSSPAPPGPISFPRESGQATAKRLEQAGSAIGARAPADSDHDTSRTCVQRDADELAGPARGGVQRVERVDIKAPEPGRFGKLDDDLVIPEPSQACGQRFAGGTGYAMAGDPGGRSPRGKEHVKGAVTSVSDRHLDRVGARIADTARHRRRRGPGAERALESVRRADRDETRSVRRSWTHASAW